MKTGDFFDLGVAQSCLFGEARPVVKVRARFFKNFLGVASRVGVEASETVNPLSGSVWAKKGFRFRPFGKARSKFLSSVLRRSALSVHRCVWPLLLLRSS